MKRFWKLVFLFLVLFACKKNDGREDIIDNVKPTVINIQPANGEIGVPINTDIIVSYSEPVQKGNSANITVNNKTVDSNINGSDLFINAVLEENTNYTVSVSEISILDLAKNYAQALTFSFSTKTEKPVSISEELVVNNPSQQAINVYNFMKDNYGEKIISASMANVNWNINEAEWVKQHTGKYPAIATFDYVHLPFSPANWIDYSNVEIIEEWWNNNGIVSAGWHWNVPSYEGSGEIGFYSSETSFKASNATVEGTWENNVVKTDLEKMAGYLKLLQERNIPVIWRPLHEAAGNIYEYSGGSAWFWWGASGAEAYKKLWKYMFNYFNEQGLNNLIWIWTTQTKDNDFYPGDDYVDIIGRDIYNNSDANSIASQFISIQEVYPNKMVTLSELGNTANISSQWTAGAKWSFFMPWYDYERTNNVNETDFNETNHEHANANWWNNAINQNYTITRDQMPSLK